MVMSRTIEFDWSGLSHTLYCLAPLRTQHPPEPPFHCWRVLTNTVKSENKDQKAPTVASTPADKWFEALASMFELAAQSEGQEKTARLAGNLLESLRAKGIEAPKPVSTPYINTIPVEDSAPFPATGRWNGGSRATSAGTRWRWWSRRIASTSGLAATSPRTPPRRRFTRWLSTISSAGATDDFPGDMVYFQGHASPGMYARAFLEGRLDEQHLQQFPPGTRRRRRACRRIRIRI